MNASVRLRPVKAEILDAEFCDAVLALYDCEQELALRETKERERASGRAWLLCGCARVRR